MLAICCLFPINGILKETEDITKKQKDALTAAMTLQKFKKGDNIVSEGDLASSFYIIKEGEVAVLVGTKEVRRMHKNESFGEQALYYNTNRTSTVQAVEETTCIALGGETVQQVLGDHVRNVAIKNIQRWAFEKDPIFGKMTKVQTEKILDKMKFAEIPQGELVIRKDQSISEFFVVISGDLIDPSSNKTIIPRGGLFGTVEKTTGAKTQNDLIFKEKGAICKMTFEECEQIIEGSISSVLKMNENTHEKRNFEGINKFSEVAHLVLFEKLIFIKEIGSGQFGTVYLVKDPTTALYFALKAINKRQILMQNLEQNVLVNFLDVAQSGD